MINNFLCVKLHGSPVFGIWHVLKLCHPALNIVPVKEWSMDSGPVSYCFLSILLFTDEGRHFGLLEYIHILLLNYRVQYEFWEANNRSATSLLMTLSGGFSTTPLLVILTVYLACRPLLLLTFPRLDTEAKCPPFRSAHILSFLRLLLKMISPSIITWLTPFSSTF